MFWKSKEQREEKRAQKAELEAAQAAYAERERQEWVERELTLKGLATLCSRCAPRIVALLTRSYAAKGRPFKERGETLFFSDVSDIITNFARASGKMDQTLGCILVDVGAMRVKPSTGWAALEPIDESMYELKAELRKEDEWNFWYVYNEEHGEEFDQPPEIALPKCIELLQTSSSPEDVELVLQAAESFLRLVKLIRSAIYSQPEANDFVCASYDAMFSLITEAASQAKSGTSQPPNISDFLRTLEESPVCDCEACVAASQVLGVPVDAGSEAVRGAYRDLAKVWHPDRFSDGDARLKARAEAAFAAISAAHSTLTSHRSNAVSTCSDNVPADVASLNLLKLCGTVSNRTATLVQILAEHSNHVEPLTKSELSSAITKVLAMQQSIVDPITRLLPRLGVDPKDLRTTALKAALDQTSLMANAVREKGRSLGLVRE